METKKRYQRSAEYGLRLSLRFKELWQDPVWAARQLEFRTARKLENARLKGLLPPKVNRGGTVGPKARKLTDEQVRNVKLALAKGIKVGKIAQIFGVSPPIISYIKSGKTYKHVK